MSELPHPASSGPSVPVLRLVEWIASNPESGVLRLRGEFPDHERPLRGAPTLVLRDDGGTLTRRAPLNEERPDGDGWRAAYLIAGALLGGAVEKWLEWPDGARVALPDVDVSAGDGRSPVAPPERGAEVFDRAVLAERRAQRAESAQRAQARTAEAAVAALGALERRVEELTRERDALVESQSESVPTDDAAATKFRLVEPVPERASDTDLAHELEAARAAQHEAEQDARRNRQALDEALGTLGRLRVQAAEVRLRMRIQVASASADAVRLAVLENERRGLRGRLHDVRGELQDLRARFSGERARAHRLASELERTRSRTAGVAAERDALRLALAGEREARARAERELRSEQAAAQAHRARVRELEALLTTERARVDERSEALQRRLDELGAQLRDERAARASLAVQLRVARSTAGAARAEAAARAAAQSKLEREHAEALSEAAAARAELAAMRRSEPASEVASTAASRPERRLSELEAELIDTRAALEGARVRPRRATLAATARTDTGPATPDQAPTAEAPRPALSADAGQLRRRVAVFQDAAARANEGDAEPAATGRVPDPAGIAARLDAAAASLRAEAAADAVSGPRGRGVADTGAVAREAEDSDATARTGEEADATADTGDDDATGRADEGTAATVMEPEDDAPLPEPSLALTVRPSSAVVVAERPSAGTAATAAVAEAAPRREPPLRRALIRLAAEEPFTAARLFAELLPAQGAFLREDVDYDLTIRELGTFAVTVAAGRTTVRALRRPRSRREAEMHLTLHALTLAELLAGRPRRVGRVLAPVRLRGSRRGLEVLAVLGEAGPSLAEVARAGAVLDPGLVMRVLPHLIDAADTDGHAFTVAQEIVDPAPRMWYLTVDGRRGLRVAAVAPDHGCDARVTMDRATFERLLRDEPLESPHKPWIRGDFTAVETLRRWIDAARG